MKKGKIFLTLLIPLLGLLFVVSIVFSHRAATYEFSDYVLSLSPGWSVTASPDTAGNSLNADGKQAATIEVVQTDGYGDSITGIESNYFGQHEEFLAQESIPLTSEQGSMTKVTTQYLPSAAEEESGLTDFSSSIHYIIQFHDSRFIDVLITDENLCAEVEEILKTIDIKA